MDPPWSLKCYVILSSTTTCSSFTFQRYAVKKPLIYENNFFFIKENVHFAFVKNDEVKNTEFV